VEESGFNIVEKLLGITNLGTQWVLWLLIVLSIASVAIVIERAIFFFRMQADFQSFIERFSKAVATNDWNETQKICETSPSLAAQTALRGMEVKDRGAEAMEKVMMGYMIGQRQNLDRGLILLGTLGNNAPFIGLFGTVIGIIIAFKDLAQNPAGGPAVVMAGISEALIATAVGIMVAIPAVIFFNIFQRMVRNQLSRAESVSKLLLSQIRN
jgi:biopolymer transport protein ExbB